MQNHILQLQQRRQLLMSEREPKTTEAENQTSLAGFDIGSSAPATGVPEYPRPQVPTSQLGKLLGPDP